MNTVLAPMYEWKDIPWRKLEKSIFKLQKRIYQASSRGEVKVVHRLQRLLMKSWGAKCLAVRKVTQENRGKNTAGIDGISSFTPKQRLSLVKKLELTEKAKPTRRVWIPKPGKKEKRPLGIPTMYDRALQALVKLALEPEWEALFESRSYGFRPGRSAHDAIKVIFLKIRRLEKYVLDADISKCFDKINHQALLTKLNTSPTIRRTIKAWLRCGVMDGKQLFPSTEGTPQGGVISPLLANIALHGLEEYLKAAYPTTKKVNGKFTSWGIDVVRYADDFLIMHRDLNEIKRAKALVEKWLENMGLELSQSKTRIIHTLNEHDGHPAGFDFLGFSFRQYPLGKRNRRTIAGKHFSIEAKFKTIITPSNEAISRHKAKISQIVDGLKSAPQTRLIMELNPVIQGWANYYSSVNSKETFGDIDHWLWEKLRRWAKFRHPKKGDKWVAEKYWHVSSGKWDFSKEKLSLKQHKLTPIKMHVNVLDTRSPFDGDWVYWSTRRGNYPGTSNITAKLLKAQNGKCKWCDLYFGSSSLIELDHINSNRRDNKIINLQLLHGHCHDSKHAHKGV